MSPSDSHVDSPQRPGDDAGPTTSQSLRSIEDPQVLEAIQQYREALEAGEPVDRQELLQRVSRGCGRYCAVSHTRWSSYTISPRRCATALSDTEALTASAAVYPRRACWATSASSARSAAAAWAWSTRPSRSRLAAAWR